MTATASPMMAISPTISTSTVLTIDDLLLELEPDLLRGAPLHVCLNRCGRYWVQESDQAQVNRLTRPAEQYHHFLSHDWGTSAFLKYVSLLIYYNSGAATLATILVSAALGVAVACDILPEVAWMPVFGYVVFFTFLLFWQQLRRLVLRPMIVFLDKLCIPQDDEDLKARCIFGLAGFLDRAETLVVLWSPRYFARLWCTYEIATWLKNPGKPKPVVFLPVQISILFMICFLVVSLVQATTVLAETALLQSTASDWTVDAIFLLIGINAIMASILLPLCFFFWTKMFKDVAELHRQLTSFKVQETSCYCCTQRHRDPATGAVISCDRKLIYGVLKKWYGGSKKNYLEVFNGLVREQLSLPIQRKLQDNTLLLQYLAAAGLAAICPFFAMWIPRLARSYAEEGSIGLLRRLQPKVYLILLVLCMLHVSVLIGKAGVDLASCFNQILLACGQACFETLMCLMLWFPFSVSMFMTDENSYLPAVTLGVLFLVDMYLFTRALPKPAFARGAARHLLLLEESH